MLLRVTALASGELFGENGSYPGWKKTKEIPATLLREYKTFLLFRIEPHQSRSDYHCDISQPYNVTIDKDLFEKGHIVIG